MGLPFSLALPQFQTTADGMGEVMFSSDCGDLSEAMD